MVWHTAVVLGGRSRREFNSSWKIGEYISDFGVCVCVCMRACVRALFKTSLRSEMARENSYESEDRKGVKKIKSQKGTEMAGK